MKRQFFAGIVAVAVMLGAGAHGRAALVSDAPASITIAYQPGLSYATFIVMKQQRTLEKLFPGTTVDWRVLASGSAIRDGFLAGQIQIGASGAGPFLIGWDRGVGYRMVAALNDMNLWLMVRDPKIRSIKDLNSSSKIGVPAPDSIQAVILRKAAQDQLGNAHAFDTGFVAIEHPLGLAALEAGQLDAHLTSPPFQDQERERGAHAILKSYDVFGKSTFNCVYTSEAFANEHPRFIEAFAKAVATTTVFINTHRDATAKILAQDTDGKQSSEQFAKWLGERDVEFTTVPQGILKVAKFMASIGFLSKAPRSMNDIELPLMRGAGN